MAWDINTRKYTEGKKIKKQDKELFNHIINDLAPEVEADLKKDDYVNFWLGMCHTFPEYDLFSFLNYPNTFLKKFNAPLNKEGIFEEKQNLLNFFDTKKWNDDNEDFDVIELTHSIIHYLLEDGCFYYYQNNNSWDLIINCPSETDDEETVNNNRRILKYFLDAYLE